MFRSNINSFFHALWSLIKNRFVIIIFKIHLSNLSFSCKLFARFFRLFLNNLVKPFWIRSNFICKYLSSKLCLNVIYKLRFSYNIIYIKNCILASSKLFFTTYWIFKFLYLSIRIFCSKILSWRKYSSQTFNLVSVLSS
nr:MAG TPA: hypothetical protein [Caudoviricetes sp.]